MLSMRCAQLLGQLQKPQPAKCSGAAAALKETAL
jgi:hypothetical protein